MSRDDTINMEHYEILFLAHKICNVCQKLSKRCSGGLCSNVVRWAKEIYYSQFAKDEKVRANGMREKQIEKMKYDICTAADYCYDACEECNLGRLAEHLYNAGYRKQSEWISVDERLPDAQGYFLIVDKEGQMNTAFYSLRFGWFSHIRIKNITHWMPLPEAPKGGEE